MGATSGRGNGAIVAACHGCQVVTIVRGTMVVNTYFASFGAKYVLTTLISLISLTTLTTVTSGLEGAR